MSLVAATLLAISASGCSGSTEAAEREDIFWARLVRHHWQGSQPDALKSGYRVCEQNPTRNEQRRLLRQHADELALAQRTPNDIEFPQPLTDLQVIERAAFSILCPGT
jgi:hypothetical protein